MGKSTAFNLFVLRPPPLVFLLPYLSLAVLQDGLSDFVKESSHPEQGCQHD